MKKPSKVLVLGSSALKIGEAGEFDYSGSQTIKALKEEGITTVLINPNVATVQTSEHMADSTYFLPLTSDFAEKVIRKERPDGIVLGAGGQTALNCGASLYNDGILEELGVAVLGTPVEAILDSEDRQRFANSLSGIGVPIPNSRSAGSLEEALDAGEDVGYPCIVRAAFALGGLGSGVCRSAEELRAICARAFSLTDQVLVEEYLEGWKEIEYEVVRDHAGTAMTICNMENIDPMGIHTGESVVVAPSQTLTDREYHHLRELSIEVASHLGIVGECNVQFALSPSGGGCRVIEVNARLSRSSALASKATGYPLAYIAAKLALGKRLHEISNNVTGCTAASFEPALDYIAVKVPRWDFSKFRRASSRIGSSMKSVGEVMALGRRFEEALQKALRMIQTGRSGLVLNKPSLQSEDVMEELTNPTDNRIFAVAQALREGMSLQEVGDATGIDAWFLGRIANVVAMEGRLRRLEGDLPERELLLESKRLGFADVQIATAAGLSEERVRNLRHSMDVTPCIKQVDTVAGEFPASTNYLYLTYNGEEDDVAPSPGRSVMVLGSGTYRVGSSVEFDWCCVSAIRTLRNNGIKTIVINHNPETVSTDFDESERLYFEELSLETVLEIYHREGSEGALLSVGGQVANNLAIPCWEAGMTVLGTSPEDIDRAENRHTFSALLEDLGVSQPEWTEARSTREALGFARSVGYPVLVRPSYVLSGSAMGVAADEQQLTTMLQRARELSSEHPVVVSKFIENAREIDFDGVAKNGRVVLSAVSEHVENAGVHSGDATLVLPPQRLYLETMRQISKTSDRIARALNINGPFNIQFIALENRTMVIECNLRASRSFPFVSKVIGRNFIEAATEVMLGHDVDIGDRSYLNLEYVGVKAPQFSFTRLEGADPVTGVEMASTGEVACLGRDFDEAYLKALISVGYRFPLRRVLACVGGVRAMSGFLDCARKLSSIGTEIWALPETASFLSMMGVPNVRLDTGSTEQDTGEMEPSSWKGFDLMVCLHSGQNKESYEMTYPLRRSAADHGVPVVTNTQVMKRISEALSRTPLERLEIRSWQGYKEIDSAPLPD